MGIKSTVQLTRKEAEARYLDLFERLNPRNAYLGHLTNVEIEDALERMNDELARRDGGETGFDNFLIVERTEI